jgi:hypothetical protein
MQQESRMTRFILTAVLAVFAAIPGRLLAQACSYAVNPSAPMVAGVKTPAPSL